MVVKEEQQKLHNLEIVWQLTESLQNSNNLHDILDTALNQAMRATHSESATLWLNDEQGEFLYPYLAHGPNISGLQGVKLKMGEGMAGWVAENRKSQIIHDAQQDPRWAGRVDDNTGYSTHSLLCVPLITSSSTLGCLQFINKLEDRLFDDEDLVLVADMAALIAISIEKRGLLVKEEEPKAVLLHFKDARKTYLMGEVQVQALKGVSVEIYDGELLVILGPSGSGKSTMLNLLGGMDQATSGNVLFNNQDLSVASDKELTLYRRHQVGFVFQFYNLIPDLTAGENIELAAELVDDPFSIDEVLEEVGLSNKKNNFPSQMSGGEQQRVSIARAIVKKPRILLCDEPTGALDDQTGKMILILLEKIARNMGGTVVIVTHNTAIAPMADRVLKMRNGQIVELLRNPHPECAKDLVL